MDFTRLIPVAQQIQPQHSMGAADAYAPLSSLGVSQSYYTLESLESLKTHSTSQQQIYPPGTLAYPSSDGTGAYASITMQRQEQDTNLSMAAQYQPGIGSYGGAQPSYYSDPAVTYGNFSLHSRLAPDSVTPSRYALEDHYVPPEAQGSLLQYPGHLAFAAAQQEPAREYEYSAYPPSHLGFGNTTPNVQVLNAGSIGTAKKKMASQFKHIPALPATKKNNNMQPPKRHVPIVSGPAAPGWCSVCQIECNSKEVLEQHCLGRKHRNRLEKRETLLTAPNKTNERHMQQLVSRNTEGTSKRDNNKTDTQFISNSSLINGKKNQNDFSDIKSKAVQQQESTGNKSGVEVEAKASDSTLGKRKHKVKAAADDIDTKRQRLLEAGTDISAVKVCTLCNAVCNSQIVYDAHLAGKKHAAQVKKLEEEVNAIVQGNISGDQANAVAQGNDNGTGCIADGEQDNKDGKAN